MMSLIKISVHDILLAGLEFVSLENLFQPILIKYTKTGKNFIISTITIFTIFTFLFIHFIYLCISLFIFPGESQCYLCSSELSNF